MSLWLLVVLALLAGSLNVAALPASLARTVPRSLVTAVKETCFFDPRFNIPSFANCAAPDCAASYSQRNRREQGREE
jgi:hypothetical protein